MDGIFAEVEVKKQYKNAQVQFQLEEDINLPETKPDLETIVAQRFNPVIGDVKCTNGKVCVEGEVEYLILYSREDSVGRLEVLEGTLPFQQCLIMEGAMAERTVAAVSVSAEQVKKRNNRKLATLLTMEFEAKDEGSYSCKFMEDYQADIEKKTGKLEVMTLCNMGIEKIMVRELVSLSGNRPTVGRLLMDDTWPRGVEVYMEDGKFLVRGEMYSFVCYESEEENPKLQFVELTVPFECEAECGFCRDDLTLEYDYKVIHTKLSVQQNEDGEERDFSVQAELELHYELKEKCEFDYLQDAYSLTEEIQPLWQDVQLEGASICNAKRVRLSEIFAALFDEKMLQVYPMRGRVVLSEPEIVEGSVLLEGMVHAEILYLTVNPTNPPVIAKVQMPYHQQFEMREPEGVPSIKLRGDVAQLTANIIDSGQAEVKCNVNLTACIGVYKTIPIITKMEKMQAKGKNSRLPGVIGYIVQKEDTLWSMAKENKTTIDEICKINNLSGNSVAEGEKLIICRNI